METGERVLISTRPSVVGFSRRYLLAFTPLALLFLALVADSYLYHRFQVRIGWVPLTLALLLGAAVASWVLRSKEALASTLLAMGLASLASFLSLSPKVTLWELPGALLRGLEGSLLLGCAAGAAATCVGVEVYRRSINYIISNIGVRIRGGVWRRQEHFLPYGHVGRVILEQSLIGKLLDYGTVILVSAAEWGAEYYTRGAGAQASAPLMPVKGEALYARTLKEVSRDPLKCLYGIRKPRKVYEVITKQQATREVVEFEQLRYLKEIAEEIKRKKLEE